MPSEVRPIRCENSTRWPAGIAPDGTAEQVLLTSPGANKRINITQLIVSVPPATASSFNFLSKVGSAASVNLLADGYIVATATTVVLNFPHTLVLPENAALQVTLASDLNSLGGVVAFGYDDYI